MNKDQEKEDTEASEASLERPFFKLTIAMTGLDDGDAWRDFLNGARAMLGIDSEWRKVGVPKDFWDYWMAVTTGHNPDYNNTGRRLIN